MDSTSGDDNKSQQSSSVMTPQGISDDNKPSGPSPAATTRQQRVDFERRMMFNSALSQGKSPEEAARYSGVKVGHGESLKSTEIMDLKYRGTSPKRRPKL